MILSLLAAQGPASESDRNSVRSLRCSIFTRSRRDGGRGSVRGSGKGGGGGGAGGGAGGSGGGGGGGRAIGDRRGGGGGGVGSRRWHRGCLWVVLRVVLLLRRQAAPADHLAGTGAYRVARRQCRTAIARGREIRGVRGALIDPRVGFPGPIRPGRDLCARDNKKPFGKTARRSLRVVLLAGVEAALAEGMAHHAAVASDVTLRTMSSKMLLGATLDPRLSYF